MIPGVVGGLNRLFDLPIWGQVCTDATVFNLSLAWADELVKLAEILDEHDSLSSILSHESFNDWPDAANAWRIQYKYFLTILTIGNSNFGENVVDFAIGYLRHFHVI